jgi:hypothetical protein
LCTVNLFVDAILICYYRCKIFVLRHVFVEFISSRFILVLPILETLTHAHTSAVPSRLNRGPVYFIIVLCFCIINYHQHHALEADAFH